MIITKFDPFTGKENSVDLPIDELQLHEWQSGTLIHKAMPQLNADQREFMISGMKPGTWEEHIHEDDY